MNYVCSDIHGNLTRFNKLIEKLNADDHLYILGDCIDRGPDGIKILKYIMNHNDKITLLCGNHEDFMYSHLFAENQDKLLGKQLTRYSIWFESCNGGQITYDKYKKESKEIQSEIFNFLSKLPLIILLNINGTKYHLSHSGTIKNVLQKQIWNRIDLNKYDINQIIWDSLYRDDSFLNINDYPKDYTCIFGHVPVQRITNNISSYEIYKNKNTIDIDGGCAYGKQEIIYDDLHTALSVFCLETQEVFYIT